MNLILVGPGRAGRAVSLAAKDAGHRLVGVLARDPEAARSAAEELSGEALPWEGDLPAADLLLIAVRDDAIGEVVARLAGRVRAVEGAAHLSGLVPAAALRPLGIPWGSLHPLQTMPNPQAGAERLAGAWFAVTAEDDYLADRLFALAASLGGRPFELEDEAKPLYHAAAAAAANYPLASLAMARRLFEAAGVPFEAAGPLVRAVVDNALSLGPEEALTGPIARGDVATVRAQVAAVRSSLPELAADYEALARATARVAGTTDLVEEALR